MQDRLLALLPPLLDKLEVMRQHRRLPYLGPPAPATTRLWASATQLLADSPLAGTLGGVGFLCMEVWLREWAWLCRRQLVAAVVAHRRGGSLNPALSMPTAAT